MAIRIDDIHAIKLLAQAAHIQFIPRLHHAVARYSESDILMGGVLFTDNWGGSVQMHVAGFCPRWASKSLLYLAFDYPFRQLGVKKVFGLVPEYNVAARNLNLHLGFKIEYLTYDVFNFADGVNGMYLMSMTCDECRWLNMKLPYIEYAPLERTSRIEDMPLAAMPTVGAMQ